MWHFCQTNKTSKKNKIQKIKHFSNFSRNMVFQISGVFTECKICNFLHLSTPCLKITATCVRCGRDWHPIRKAPRKKGRKRSRPKLLDDVPKKRETIPRELSPVLPSELPEPIKGII